MEVKYYPNKETVEKAMQADDPLLMLIDYEQKQILLSNIDDSFEHIILLRQLNYRETDIDKFFRVVVNQEGADWTFVCPSDYKRIEDKNRRIETFYSDGIKIITNALKVIGYENVPINIPNRYRRHFNMLNNYNE